jgi:hypothetical protein
MSIDDEIDSLLNKDKIIEKPEIKKEEKTEIQEFDTIQEQIEGAMVSAHCPESIKAEDLKKIVKNPENYIEINFVKNIRIVDSFYIPSNIRSFHYKTEVYTIIEETVYLLPTEKDYFMMTCFFRQGNNIPIDFIQKNEGITGKELALLYDKNMYVDLMSGEEGKYNFFVVCFLCASISCFLVGLYFLMTGGF